MIGYQESNRTLKGVKLSINIKKSDAGEKTLKIQRELNNATWSKATMPLLDVGKCEHSVNIKLQWESRRKLRRHVSKVDCVGITRVQVQGKQEPFWTVRGAKETEKASNKCLPDAVLTASARVQAPGKGVNGAGSKASKQM